MVPRKEKQGLSLKAIKGENSFYQLVSGVAMGTSQKPRFKCQISLLLPSFPFFFALFLHSFHYFFFFLLYKIFFYPLPFFSNTQFPFFFAYPQISCQSQAKKSRVFLKNKTVCSWILIRKLLAY